MTKEELIKEIEKYKICVSDLERDVKFYQETMNRTALSNARKELRKAKGKLSRLKEKRRREDKEYAKKALSEKVEKMFIATQLAGHYESRYSIRRFLQENKNLID